MLGNSFKEYARVYNLYLSSDICENVVNSDSTLVLSGNFLVFFFL